MAEERDDVSPPADSSLIDAGAEPAQPADEAISREVLKAAHTAFKKRWKLTRLDYESRIGRSPLSSGHNSAIVGIEGPREFPRAVWEELVKQGRLKRAGSGLYAMP